ncbi:MAG TPA: hypothetical protein VFV97_14525 [Rhodanobacteraceae bacterium]|nr:hypothetical protein [Rhodanobacteraceae bacterium]
MLATRSTAPRTGLLAVLLACCGAAGAQSIDDAGIRAARLRGDLPAGLGTAATPLTLTYAQPTAEGCLFDATDSFAACPGRAGLPNLPNGVPVWAGGLEQREACGGSTTRTGDTWVGCVAYASNPGFALNNPTSQYWVVVANDEPSFDHCNSGPPGMSHPVASATATPAPLFGVDALASSGSPDKRLRITLAPGNKNFYCTDIGAYEYTVPFLSVGAQHGRGNAGAVATISRTGSPRGTIVFDGGISSVVPIGCRTGTEGICNAHSLGIHAGIYGIATWGGMPHLLFVDFYGVGAQDYSMYAPGESKWNWPIQDSFYYPGAEVITFVAGTQLSTYCGIDLARYTTDLAQRHYTIDFGKLFACANDLGLVSPPMPAGNIALDGIHWYIEASATLGSLGNDIAHAETAIFRHGFD